MAAFAGLGSEEVGFGFGVDSTGCGAGGEAGGDEGVEHTSEVGADSAVLDGHFKFGGEFGECAEAAAAGLAFDESDDSQGVFVFLFGDGGFDVFDLVGEVKDEFVDEVGHFGFVDTGADNGAVVGGFENALEFAAGERF